MTRQLRSARLAFLALSALPLAAATVAAADGHGTEVFGGYSFLHVQDSNRHGGNLALGFDLGPISAFVDASAHWGSQSDVGLSDFSLMAGPGARFGTRGGTVFFVRALGGMFRNAASISVLDVDISEGSTALGFMGGGGVDFRVAPTLAVRVQADYLLFDAGAGGVASCVPGVPSCDDTGGDGWASGYRLSAGVVYRFGSAR